MTALMAFLVVTWASGDTTKPARMTWEQCMKAAIVIIEFERSGPRSDLARVSCEMIP